MKCKKIIDRFLEQDVYETIPLSIRLHIFLCPKCKKEIFQLKSKFNSLGDSSSFVMEHDMSDVILNKIIKLEVEFEQNISSFKWLSTGSIIITGTCLIPFSSSFSWMNNHFGANLEIPLSIVMGLAVSIYAAIFIATHMNEIKKLVDQLEKYK